MTSKTESSDNNVQQGSFKDRIFNKITKTFYGDSEEASTNQKSASGAEKIQVSSENKPNTSMGDSSSDMSTTPDIILNPNGTVEKNNSEPTAIKKLKASKDLFEISALLDCNIEVEIDIEDDDLINFEQELIEEDEIEEQDDDLEDQKLLLAATQRKTKRGRGAPQKYELDATQLYLSEIGFSPLLSAEEEVFYSRKSLNGCIDSRKND